MCSQSETADIAEGPSEEEKMEELRIYFPNLDEDTLLTHLVLLNGDVQQVEPGVVVVRIVGQDRTPSIGKVKK